MLRQIANEYLSLSLHFIIMQCFQTAGSLKKAVFCHTFFTGLSQYSQPHRGPLIAWFSQKKLKGLLFSSDTCYSRRALSVLRAAVIVTWAAQIFCIGGAVHTYITENSR